MAAHLAVFTLFPPLIEEFRATSLIGKAVTRGLLRLDVHDLRSHATGVHQAVDDAPFGGGAGMVLAPGPVFACVEAAAPPRPLFVLTPGGERFDQRRAHDLAERITSGELPGFSLLCGRYEGFDQRIHDHLSDGELSVGDVVLGGGEVAAMLVIEAVVRLLPGVMGNEASGTDESFTSGLLEYPQYTRPATFRGWDVPEVLRSGDHGRIERWRRAQALVRTARVRPDLLDARGGLTPAEQRLLGEFGLALPLTPPAPDPGAAALTLVPPARLRAARPGRLRRTLRPTNLRCPLGGQWPRVTSSSAVRTRARPRGTVMHPTDLIDREQLRTDIPAFDAGDTVKVHVRVVEGNKERVQVFQGHVIARSGDGIRETFKVRKISYGVGVERTFPLHSPTIAQIEVVTRGDVRRAKLYYLRNLQGKAAKIKEKRGK